MYITLGGTSTSTIVDVLLVVIEVAAVNADEIRVDPARNRSTAVGCLWHRSSLAFSRAIELNMKITREWTVFKKRLLHVKPMLVI